mgnify:CR=1 FL=1
MYQNLRVTLIVFHVLAVSSAAAETFKVCEECTITSINEAMILANDGDVIELVDQIYTESLTIDTLGKSISICGAVDEIGPGYPGHVRSGTEPNCMGKSD